MAARISQGFAAIGESFDKLTPGQKVAAAAVGTVGTAAVLVPLLMGKKGDKPNSLELSGGSIPSQQVKKEWDNYEASFGKEPAVGIKDRQGPAGQFIGADRQLRRTGAAWRPGRTRGPCLPAC